jgi:hypothetical protein
MPAGADRRQLRPGGDIGAIVGADGFQGDRMAPGVTEVEM